jgi:hypothetical protein
VGFGVGFGLAVAFGVATTFVLVADGALVDAGFVEADARVVALAAAGGFVGGTTASTRAGVVVVVDSATVTASAAGFDPLLSTAAMNPPSGTEGAGAGGVATRPRRPPIAKPTKMPTIDWTDFESTNGPH